LEKLRFEIACLKRMKYGRSSEQVDQEPTQYSSRSRSWSPAWRRTRKRSELLPWNVLAQVPFLRIAA
jgi:hypothetical protein